MGGGSSSNLTGLGHGSRPTSSINNNNSADRKPKSRQSSLAGITLGFGTSTDSAINSNKGRKSSLTGITLGKDGSGRSRSGSVGSHVQEDAASFRSKSSTIKMMMRNQAYRKSFFKFLESRGKGEEEMMDYFLSLETMKKLKEKDAKRTSFMEQRDKYERRSEGKSDDLPESIIYNSMHHWKGLVNLSDEDLAKHIERSQDEILMSMTALFEEFLSSRYFTEVKEAETKEEKRRFSQSGAEKPNPN